MVIGYVIIVQLLYAMVFLINAFIVLDCPSLFFTGLKALLAGCILLKTQGNSFKKKSIIGLDLFKIAFIGIFMRSVLRNYSLIYLSVLQVVLGIYTTPLLAFIYEYYQQKNKTEKKWFRIIISIFLIGLLYSNFYYIVLLIALCCYLYWMYASQKLLIKYTINATTLNGITHCYAGIIGLGASLFCEVPYYVFPSVTIIGLIFLSVLISTVVAKTIYLRLTAYYSISFLVLTDSLGTGIIMLYSPVFFHTNLSLGDYIFFMIITGLLCLIYFKPMLAKEVVTGF